MIKTLFESIVETMTGLGLRLDPSEGDSLRDDFYTIQLPAIQRRPDASTFARQRVERDIRIRLQFREKKDPYFAMNINGEVERVATALRPLLLFESSSLIERTGGMIAEIQFSAIDSLS